MPEPSSAVDCTKLNDAYQSIGPVVTVGDAVAKLKKIPGLSQVEGVSLIECGLDALPYAIDNPSPDNQQRVFDGFCNGVNSIINPTYADPCANDPGLN
jgi:hypothetical protein